MKLKRVCVVFCAIVLMQGCATPARVERMIVEGSDVSGDSATAALRHQMAVSDVNGGEETNPLWTSEIGNAEFKQALIESLRVAGFLSGTGDSAKYELKVQLMNVIQPVIGLDLKVEATIRYVLIDKATLNEVVSEVIQSAYTATFSEAPYAVARLRVANEGAAHANIEKLIDKLHALSVGSDVSLR